jgi:hypothetical protein
MIGNYRNIRGGYTTLSNTRLGPFRLVIDCDLRYWTVGITVGVGWYLRLDVGPVGISVMKSDSTGGR